MSKLSELTDYLPGDEEAVIVRRLTLKTIVGSLAVLAAVTACGSDGTNSTANTPETSATTTSEAETTTTAEAPVTTRAFAAVPDRTGATTAPTSPPAAQSTAYFANCTDARAAGAAPLRRSDPGYRSALDRDGDGVACET
jgi:hypothetical protein